MPYRAALIATSLVMLAGCGGESPGASAATGAPSASDSTSTSTSTSASSASSAVTCDTHYREVREAVLGVLRGTESMSLIKLATVHSEGMLSAPPAGTAPADMSCRAESRGLRRERKPNTDTGWPLSPQCEALVQRLDSDCLQPLVERGAPFSSGCKMALMGVASVSGQQQANMTSPRLCEGALGEL